MYIRVIKRVNSSKKGNNCFTADRHGDCLPALSNSSTNNDNCCNGNDDVNEQSDNISNNIKKYA